MCVCLSPFLAAGIAAFASAVASGTEPPPPEPHRVDRAAALRRGAGARLDGKHTVLTYLAAPYSHPDPAVVADRVRKTNETAARLFRDGHSVFSPISHTHPIFEAMPSLGGGFQSWADYDNLMIDRCDDVLVLRLPGWEQSVGVRAETEHARATGKPVRYTDYGGEP